MQYEHAHKHRSQNLACTDCSLALEQATDKFDTVLELLEIGDKNAATQNSNKCMHASTEAKT